MAKTSTQAYVDTCIREVLAKSKGNVKMAQTLLGELALTDERLLLGLTKPYLGGIVAHAVDRTIKKALTPHAPRKSGYIQRKEQKLETALDGLVSDVLSGKSVYTPPSVPVQKKKPASKQEIIAQALQTQRNTRAKLEQTMGAGTLDGLFAQLAKNFEEGQNTDEAVAPNTVKKTAHKASPKVSNRHVEALHTIAKHKYRVKKT